MNDIKFTWDDKKNDSNEKKHGVSFVEAQTIFFDENAIEYYDPNHSSQEDRFIMLGLSFKLRVLIVSHCVRERGRLIRIISARKATRLESKNYWGNAK